MLLLALPLTAALSSTATARAALLNAIAPLERGFKADKQQRLAVESAIKELAASAPLQALPDISGDWELIYTDAPDILGLDAQAGPLVTCTRIGQQISEADGQAAWSECASSQHPVRHLTASEPGPQALATLWNRAGGGGGRLVSAGERLPVRRVLLVPTRGRPQPPPPDLAADLHAGTIANVIEYGPRAWAANLVGQAKGDLLQQRVITSFERRTDAPTKARGLTRVHPTPTPNPYS